jgi:hypothetical protein
MRFVDPLDYEDARHALKASAERIRSAEDEIEQQITKAADAEADYRKGLAKRILELRTGTSPKGATEAETLAKGSEYVTALSQKRDIERDMVKLRFAVLEDRRGDRASLHKIVDWSMKVAGVTDGDGQTYVGRRAT